MNIMGVTYWIICHSNIMTFTFYVSTIATLYTLIPTTQSLPVQTEDSNNSYELSDDYLYEDIFNLLEIQALHNDIKLKKALKMQSLLNGKGYVKDLGSGLFAAEKRAASHNRRTVGGHI